MENPQRSLAHPTRGFTLVELMVVVAILAGVLLLVPANLYRFGARSRLENAANTLVSLVAAAREQAIQDGQQVKIEFGIYETEDGERHHGHRMIFSSAPVESSDLLNEEGDRDEEKVVRKEMEWLKTKWHELSGGVLFVGVSERSGHWLKITESQSYVVAFGPDGGVEKGFAVRVESEDLADNVKRENRTITVLCNALTAEAELVEGLEEMPETREESEFNK